MEDINNCIDNTKFTLKLLKKHSNEFNNLYKLLKNNNIEDENIDTEYINEFNIYEDKCLYNLKKILKNVDNYKIVKKECQEFKKNFKNIKKIFNKKILKYIHNKYDKNLVEEHFNIKNVGNQIKNEVDKVGGIVNEIKNIPKKIVDPIINAFNKFGDIMKNIFNEIKNIANKTGEVFKKVFKEVFKVMLFVFEFIKETVIPFLKDLIEYGWKIIKALPYLIKQTVAFSKYISKMIKLIITNYIKSPITPVILFFILFIGLQIYFKLLTGLQMPIPHIILIIFCLFIILSILCFNYEYIQNIDYYTKYYTSKLIQLNIIKDFFKTHLKIPNFGENTEKDIKIILNLIMKNLPRFILFILILLLVLKYIIRYIIISKIIKK